MTINAFITEFIKTRGEFRGRSGKFYARDGVLFVRPADNNASRSIETLWVPARRTPNADTLIPIVWFPNQNFYVSFGHTSKNVASSSEPFFPGAIDAYSNMIENCFPNRKKCTDILNARLMASGLPRAGVNALPIRYDVARLFGDDAMATDELLRSLSRAVFDQTPSHEFVSLISASDSYYRVFTVCPDNANYGSSSAAQLLFDFAVTAWANCVLAEYRNLRSAAFQLRDLAHEMNESADIHGTILHKLGTVHGSTVRDLTDAAISSAYNTVRAICSKMYSASSHLSYTLAESLATLVIPTSSGSGNSRSWCRENMLASLTGSHAIPSSFARVAFALGDTSSDCPVTVDSAFALLDQVKKHFNAIIKYFGHPPIQDPLGIPLEPDNLEALATAHDLVKHDLLSLQINE